MSLTHPNSPAEILRQAIIDGGVGSSPSKTCGNPWPVYVGHLPDEPDNAVCIFDTVGISDGRLMGTGEYIDHPGYQIRVRGSDYQTGYARIKEIKQFLSSLKRTETTISDVTYRIDCATRQGTILSLGQEVGPKRRSEFTTNGTITFSELS